MSSLSRVRSQVGPLTGALVVLTPLSQLGFVPISAVIASDLGTDSAGIGLAIGAYAIAAAVASLVFGPLFDLIPARTVLPWAVGVNLLVSLGCIWVPDLSVLLAGRVLAGFANGALALIASVIVADTLRSDPAARDRAFSGLQTFVSTGAISGLALGGLCAGFDLPWLYFAIVAAYAAIILAITPLLRRRMMQIEASAPARLPARRVTTTLREVAVFLRAPHAILLLTAATCSSWVLQSSHYGLSIFLDEQHPLPLIRSGLTVLIPIGVLLGALVNQRTLGRYSPREVHGRAFVLLPIAAGGLAVALAQSDATAVWAVALICVGTVAGMVGPLQPTMIVAWYPDLRSSGSAAVSVSNSIGAALGPMVLGVLGTAWTLSGALIVSAGVALVGAALAAVLMHVALGQKIRSGATDS